jgi:sec-independent protein translocase protein TatC
MPKPDATMTFGEHLEELRRRLVFALLGLAPILALSLVFGQSILRFLIRPLVGALMRAGEPPALQAVNPVETFGAYLKISMVVTLLAGVPWCMWQFWLFVSPGLYAHERRFARFLLPLSAVLTAASAVFLYTVMLPVTLFFLIQFGSSVAQERVPVAPPPAGIALASLPVLDADPAGAPVGSAWILRERRMLRVQLAAKEVYSAPLTTGGLIAQVYRIKDYTDLVFALGLAFAVAFQTPVVMLLLSWTGIVDVTGLAKKRKHVVFVCVIVAAIITPTGDPVTLTVFAAPMYALFELGLALARFAPPARVSRGFLRRAATGARSDAESEA